MRGITIWIGLVGNCKMLLLWMYVPFEFDECGVPILGE